MITIVDYGAGNVQSVVNAFTALGVTARLTDDPAGIDSAERLVLPGVGAFGAAMDELNRRGLAGALRSAIERDVPLLGICLGMQLLFDASEESPGVQGLCVIPGVCRQLRTERVPNTGWCMTADEQTGARDYFYFVHGYYCVPKDSTLISMRETAHGFTAGVQRGAITGVQFHPEKSGEAGLRFLKRLCGL